MGADLRALLETSLGRNYDIERELGGGGMSRVFLATERALGRRVVIKVLSPELTAGISARRFEREIRLAASLQQANIVPVLAAGSDDGVPHYTMPYVEGRSLRERLASDARIPLGETIGILRDLARALVYAHERGVVHRDIKPDNVLLSGDAAVVTDFGIAKAIANARQGAAESGEAPLESTMTQVGTAVGTPAYMAPEQIAGDPSIDHRADLYSFGCLAYELLTGSPPFAGRPTHTLLAAHLGEAPIPVGERNPDTPPGLARVVMRCLEKDPALRPQSAREVLAALEGATAATGLTRLHQRMSRRQRAIVLGAAALLVMAGAVLIARQRIASRGATVSVAVIPFANLSGDSADEYLADGLADGLATSLGKVSQVRVISRSLSYRYKGQRGLDAREVGEALSAGQVLQGTVRRSGGQIHVSAQLVSTSANEEMWADEYDRPAAEAYALQGEITRAIAEALRDRLGVAAALAEPAGPAVVDPVAFDYLLRGKFQLQRRGPGVRQSIQNFERAIALDTTYAEAHAFLALALELLPYFESIREDSVRPKAIASARYAIARDSTIPEAHTALALAHQHAYEWSAADARYRQAMRLEPEEADAHIQYGRFLFYTGRFEPARSHFEDARRLDPYSAVASGWLGHLLQLGGRPEQGFDEIKRAIEIDSTNPPVLVFSAQAHAARGDTVEARRLMERLYRVVPAWRVVAASMLAQYGDTARAREFLRAIEAGALQLGTRHGTLATLYRDLGDTARFLDALERATEAREIWPTYYSLSEREFDPVRRSPRFAAILRSVGLDEAIFTTPTGGRPR